VILAIETSCDDTGAAVVAPGPTLISNVVYSQDTHARFGGVVPEVASREHVAAVAAMAQRALQDAPPIEAVCATVGPGLIGPLLVGVHFAKAFAWARGVPWLGIHHMEGHMAAALLDDARPSYPHLSLLASGGHTLLVHCRAFGAYKVLGGTRDDAAGEAFDKTAKILGLGYPGGAAIDRLALAGDPVAFNLPRALPHRDCLDFSFSGLKTAAAQAAALLRTEQSRADLCASLQEAICDVLTAKAVRAATIHDLPGIVLAGGVAANGRLRTLAAQRASAAGLWCHVPPRHLCTDNAGMIGAAGWMRFARGERSPIDLPARARWPLDEL
jgi:N6-L-threonylcarbamoyladenine synthase